MLAMLPWFPFCLGNFGLKYVYFNERFISCCATTIIQKQEKPRHQMDVGDGSATFLKLQPYGKGKIAHHFLMDVGDRGALKYKFLHTNGYVFVHLNGNTHLGLVKLVKIVRKRLFFLAQGLTLCQKSFYPYAPTLWNYLPEDIIQSNSLQSFKSALHAHLG